MATPSDLREHVLEALWSQWHELGVASTVPRRHSDDVIDPEPLVAFTATHGDLDPRLRDESIDWILRYGTFLSKARLKNVLTGWDLSDDGAFREYAATVNVHGPLTWPAGAAKPLRFRSRSRALLDDLSRPALLSLRIRALVGVGARAELIRALLCRPQVGMTAADLAVETSYTKRNVLNELEPLRLAGVVNSVRAVNADRFSLARSEQLIALIGPVPPRSTRWTRTFQVLHVMLEITGRGGKRSELQNAVEAARLLNEQRGLFVGAEMHPPPLPAGIAAWSAFLDWAVGHARAIARV
jgi:hypothetical protein